jgi:hypothetical protein
VKFDAIASSEIKSTHSLLTANFTRLRRISHCVAIFHPPARVDLAEKGLSFESPFSGGAEGNLRSLSRLTAALRSAHAFSLTPLWRQKRVPDTFLFALRFPSNQNKKAVLCTTFSFWWSRRKTHFDH